MSLQIIYDEIKKLDRKLNSMQNDINILRREIDEYDLPKKNNL